jgi:peptide methionine sulfoxide reductase MsrA
MPSIHALYALSPKVISLYVLMDVVFQFYDQVGSSVDGGRSLRSAVYIQTSVDLRRHSDSEQRWGQLLDLSSLAIMRAET